LQAREHLPDVVYEFHPGGNYFEVERVEDVWRGFGPSVRVPRYRRSLGAMLDPLLAAGITVDAGRVHEEIAGHVFRHTFAGDRHDRASSSSFYRHGPDADPLALPAGRSRLVG
jgi:hypothetical protein